MKTQKAVKDMVFEYKRRLHGLEQQSGSPRTKARLRGIIKALEWVLSKKGSID